MENPIRTVPPYYRLKSPDERGDSGRTTDKGYVMESCTPGHVVCVCSNVLNPRTWET